MALTSTSTTSASTASVSEVDTDVPAVELLLVEAVDGTLCLTGRAEGDETEAARAAGIAIAHHDRLKKHVKTTKTWTHGTTADKRDGMSGARGLSAYVEDLAIVAESL